MATPVHGHYEMARREVPMPAKWVVYSSDQYDDTPCRNVRRGPVALTFQSRVSSNW